VADQHHVAQLFALDQVQHVVDVRAQGDLRGHQVRAFAHAGQGDGMHLVAGRAQGREHGPPAPGASPGAVHENDRRDWHIDSRPANVVEPEAQALPRRAGAA
jgi:hypothetical protein